MDNLSMSGIQRVRAAINRLHCDRIPKGELVVDKGFIEDFTRVFGENGIGTSNFSTGSITIGMEMEIEFYKRLGLDLVCIPADDFINSENSFSRYISLIQEQGLFIFSLVDGAFQTVMKQMGFEDFCISVASHPDQLGKELRLYSEKMLPVIERVIHSGAHGVIIADDIAYSQGTYVSPDFIKKYLLPCWRDQVLTVKKLMVPVFFHSDGNINAVLNNIVEAGFEGLQCLDPSSGMDIKKVKQRYGQSLCLMGNIDPALLSCENKPGCCFPELARAVEDLIPALGTGGGFIFGTSCGLYTGLSPEKVLFMYEQVNKSGSCPA